MSDDMLRHYSAALDEVYRLRQALAYEAAVIDAHLGYSSMPKTLRARLVRQRERLAESALGRAEITYAGTGSQSLRGAMREIGMHETLTRSRWEATR